jgi:hypothetical protein
MQNDKENSLYLSILLHYVTYNVTVSVLMQLNIYYIIFIISSPSRHVDGVERRKTTYIELHQDGDSDTVCKENSAGICTVLFIWNSSRWEGEHLSGDEYSSNEKMKSHRWRNACTVFKRIQDKDKGKERLVGRISQTVTVNLLLRTCMPNYARRQRNIKQCFL